MRNGRACLGADMGRHISDALIGRLVARPETEFSELLKQLRRFPINWRRTKVVETKARCPTGHPTYFYRAVAYGLRTGLG